MTTANLKAPIFVNLRNRKGVQIIFDDPRYSTRFPLWSENKEGEASQTAVERKEGGSQE
jgi:flagellar assembly factor FliW